MSFLISSRRAQERDALSEFYYVIVDVLGYQARPLHARVPGLSLLSVTEEAVHPFNIIEEVRNYIEEKGPLVACLKVTPLELLFKTDLNQIVENATRLAELRINADTHWKVHIRKRQTMLRSVQVVEAIAARIDLGVVDLKNPEREIRVEIVRDLTGLSVMEPNYELRMVHYEN
ncbi:MAG: THUMP domain-containing protein [Candidatus Heimdallarchaeota archaeon]